MKLLFDQNLSPNLATLLKDIFPGSVHVQSIALDRATDDAVWEYARKHRMVIVTKDADFGERGVLLRFPPRVIWMRLGNCSTREIETMLRNHSKEIMRWSKNRQTALLTIL